MVERPWLRGETGGNDGNAAEKSQVTRTIMSGSNQGKNQEPQFR